MMMTMMIMTTMMTMMRTGTMTTMMMITGMMITTIASPTPYLTLFQLSAWYLVGSPLIPKDLSKAYEYGKKACDLGNCYSCANLSQMYKKGDGVQQDDKMAEQYRDKAKDLYDQMVKKQQPITVNQ
jgi:hypothetical protein